MGSNSEIPIIKTELPRYRCNREVRALKIESVVPCNDRYFLVPVDRAYQSIEVDRVFTARFQPQPDGYYVVYNDGHESFAPADSFENGYVLLDN